MEFLILNINELSKEVNKNSILERFIESDGTVRGGIKRLNDEVDEMEKILSDEEIPKFTEYVLSIKRIIREEYLKTEHLNLRRTNSYIKSFDVLNYKASKFPEA